MKSKILTTFSTLSLCLSATNPAFSADTVADKEAELAEETERCLNEQPEDGTLFCASAALRRGYCMKIVATRVLLWIATNMRST